MAKKTVIHVNQHNIKANQKSMDFIGAERFADDDPYTLNERMFLQPVITAKDYKQNRKGFEATIWDADGNEVASIVYRPTRPLPCGAKVWIETQLEVTVE